MTQYSEYPDPVVTQYMQQVRSLVQRMRSHPGADPVERLGRSGRSVRHHFIRLMSGVGARLSIYSSTSTCRDAAAKHEYRRFWHDLEAADWSLPSRQNVAWGLSAIRMRGMRDTDARELYDSAMGEVISRGSIGWAD